MLYNSEYQVILETPNAKNEIPVAKQTNQPTKVNKVVKTVTYTEKLPTTTVQKEEKVQNTNIQTPLINLLKNETKTTAVSQNTVDTNVTKPVVKQVSEEEKARQEEILWNEWRSNLQNQIMSDVRLPIVPEGTIFKFSFNVDKYGKISNVQTWSLSPTYNPYAIQYIAPVIRSYQGHDILNFPAGSNRYSTLVEGGWKISKTTKYSTPEDFSDTERVLNRY